MMLNIFSYNLLSLALFHAVHLGFTLLRGHVCSFSLLTCIHCGGVPLPVEPLSRGKTCLLILGFAVASKTALSMHTQTFLQVCVHFPWIKT